MLVDCTVLVDCPDPLSTAVRSGSAAITMAYSGGVSVSSFIQSE